MCRSALACLSLPCLCLVLGLACAGIDAEAPPTVLPELWAAPPLPDDPERLSLEPRTAVARLGEPVILTLHGSEARSAECSHARQGFLIEVGSPARQDAVEIQCTSGSHAAFAQVTFSDAAELPVADPYGGGVVLFKLRAPADVPPDAVGRRDLGPASLEHLLHELGAWAMAAFPLDLDGRLDYVGLRRWIAIDLPKRTNFYQAVALLRADPSLHPESYLPQDASFLRVGARKSWPARLVKAERAPDRRVGPRPPQATPMQVEEYSLGRARPVWPVRAIGASEVWGELRGRGIGIAIVDTGVDRRHRALVGNIRDKSNSDGNGLPADAHGANFAHLAIAHAYGPPGLGLGLSGDVSDWSGAAQGRNPKRWGHGTPIAALAAGFDPRGRHAGVAPQAWILPVDVQENLRVRGSADPRMREPRRDLAPLREPVWARAVGTAYAATEDVRVMTCAWPAQRANWLLYDALRFAEDNCTLPVCAVEESARGVPEAGSYPARWRTSRAVFDVWSGDLVPDRLSRPLEAMIVAGNRGDGPADLYAPSPERGRAAALKLPASQPQLARNRTHDLEASFAGPGLAAALVAGTAALVLEERPDLAPDTLREVLLSGAAGDATVSVPGALDALDGQLVGECSGLTRPGLEAWRDGEPWWKRTKWRGSLQRPGAEAESLPGSHAPEDASDESEE